MDDTTEIEPKLVPRLLVALPVISNLWLWRGELRSVEFANDLSVHAALVRWAAQAFRSFHIPLDDWFPYLTGGFSQFRQYQSTPHIIMGPIAALIGGDLSVQLSAYLLVAFWPVAVYLGVRLLGWDRWTAAAAAIVAPLLVSVTGYGFEYSSYTWGRVGLWAQAWAMFTVPIALGLVWQALQRGRHFAAAALLLGLTFAFHVITGFFAFLAVGVLFLAATPSWEKLKRAAVVGAAAAVAVSWFIVPARAGRAWGATIPNFPRTVTQSYGMERILDWLVTGRLFDRGRFPTITILVFIGLGVCLHRFRRDARARVLVALFGLALILYFGPRATGNLLRLIPGSGSILFQRFISALHFTGILLAAVGGVFVFSMAVRGVRAVRPNLRRSIAVTAVAAVAMAWLLPAWRERTDYMRRQRALITYQDRREDVDAGRRTRLIEMARDRGGGRIYAGRRNNWGRRYLVGYTRGYMSVLHADAPGFGFYGRTGSMLRGIETSFRGSDPFFYDLFNVRYLLYPRTRPPAVPAQLIERSGRHTLWTVPTSGYFMIADTIEPIRATRRTFTSKMNAFLRTRTAHQRLIPTVAYRGRPAARPTARRANPPRGSPGSVTPAKESPNGARYETTAQATRRTAVILKASFDPNWAAWVDGRKTKPYLVAPGFPAVTVEPGRHSVVFEYQPYRLYPFWFLLGAATIGGLFWFERGRPLPRRWRRRSPPELPPREESKDDAGRQDEERSLSP